MKPFIKAFKDLSKYGKFTGPRGQQTVEIEDYRMVLDPIKDRFTSFRRRSMNMGYAKFELAWYLRGDRFETSSICDQAQMWKNIIDTDGGINSNYGQYIFHGQNGVDWVVSELINDKSSRRATISLLNKGHMRSDNPDVVCTYSISFRIRDNKLNMTIHMRSWDAVWGMTNDVFCFSSIYEMVLVLLRDTYPDLEVGRYVHTADSFHVYERHFELLEFLTLHAEADHYDVECPAISSSQEVNFLRFDQKGPVPESFKFAKWLLSE